MKKIKSIIAIMIAIVLGIIAAALIIRYSYYVTFISIAVIVAVASHITMSNLLRDKDE